MLKFLKDFLFEENEAAVVAEETGAIDVNHVDNETEGEQLVAGGPATATFEMPGENTPPKPEPEGPLIMDLHATAPDGAESAPVLDLGAADMTSTDSVIDISDQVAGSAETAPVLDKSADIIDVSGSIMARDKEEEPAVEPEPEAAIEPEPVVAEAPDEVAPKDVEGLKKEVTEQIAANEQRISQHKEEIAQIERDRDAAIESAKKDAESEVAKKNEAIAALEAKNATLRETGENLATLGAGVEMLEKEEAEVVKGKEEAKAKLEAARRALETTKSDAGSATDSSPSNRFETSDLNKAA